MYEMIRSLVRGIDPMAFVYVGVFLEMRHEFELR